MCFPGEIDIYDSLQEVCPHLYIGSVIAAKNLDNLKKTGITHVLCCMSGEGCNQGEMKYNNGLAYGYVPIFDMEDEDILSYFEFAIDFIERVQARNGKVLVHCAAGVSRSATIVCCYLMKAFSLSSRQAIETLKRVRPIIQPNLGFEQQLYLFEQMGNKIDTSNHHYKIWNMKKKRELIMRSPKKAKAVKFNSKPNGAVKQVGGGGQPSQSVGSQNSDSNQQSNNNLANTDVNDGNDNVNNVNSNSNTNGDDISKEVRLDEGIKEADVKGFACKMCRTLLFTKDNIMPHQSGKGQKAFSKKKNSQAQDNCTIIFVEQLDWMGDMSEIEGKIMCPNSKCSYRLGSWNWSGSQCSCGVWVTPSISLPKSRVDQVVNRQ